MTFPVLSINSKSQFLFFVCLFVLRDLRWEYIHDTPTSDISTVMHYLTPSPSVHLCHLLILFFCFFSRTHFIVSHYSLPYPSAIAAMTHEVCLHLFLSWRSKSVATAAAAIGKARSYRKVCQQEGSYSLVLYAV